MTKSRRKNTNIFPLLSQFFQFPHDTFQCYLDATYQATVGNQLPNREVLTVHHLSLCIIKHWSINLNKLGHCDASSEYFGKRCRAKNEVIPRKCQSYTKVQERKITNYEKMVKISSLLIDWLRFSVNSI